MKVCRDCRGIFVAVEDDELVGSVRNFTRKIYCCSHEVRTCGIGEVATHENFRRKGIASLLLEKSISYMLDNQFALSILHTGNASKLYEGLGWKPVTRQFFTRRIPSDLYTPRDSTLEISTCGSEIFEENSLDRLMSVYSKSSIKYDGPIVRDNKEYWKKWIDNETGKVSWNEELRTPRKFSVYLGGTLAGFVVLQFGNESVRIREWSFFSDQLSDEFDIVDLVLSQICKYYGARELIFTFPAPISVFKQHDIVSYDNTTMYKMISSELVPKNFANMLESDCTEEIRSQRHVFWDTDRF